MFVAPPFPFILFLSIPFFALGSLKVAFVFVGSSRSLVFPLVSQSIKKNLVDAFCAFDCTPNSFFRISISDNTHQQNKFDARGTYHSPDSSHYTLVKNAISIIDSNGMVEIVNIGSDKEFDQMDILEQRAPASIRQLLRIYRKLDPRRYSMYFNRQLAYNMAVDFENANQFKYDWIVHVRPDMVWGSAIEESHMWSKEKIWFQAHWASDVPDTFALIPRLRSDMYYSLAGLFGDRSVSCLGGPNFDPKTIEESVLVANGFSENERRIIREEVCLTKYPDVSQLEYDAEVNLTWTGNGLSEILLKRKLAAHGVTLEEGTMGYAVFFVAMVRFPLVVDCFYTWSRAFISWAQPYVNNTVAVGIGCNFLSRFVKRTESLLQCRDCGESRCHRSQMSISPSLLNHSQIIAKSMVESISDCRIEEISEFRFMPFRLHPHHCVNMCLVADGDYIRASRCLESSQHVHYSSSQLFSFFPTSVPQSIVLSLSESGEELCVSVIETAFMRFAVKLLPCMEPLIVSQKFSVLQHKKIESFVRFVWHGHGNMFCLALAHLSGAESKCATDEGSSVHLVSCKESNQTHSEHRNHRISFMLEETRIRNFIK